MLLRIIFLISTTIAYIFQTLTSFAGNTLTSANMRSGAQVFPPLGHVDFCRRNRGECQLRRGAKPVRQGRVIMNSRAWRELRSVNQSVNRAIISRTDHQLHNRVDVWSVRGRYGDCEDYALRKRKVLIKKGWPSSALLITTARDHKRRPHAVLVARTTEGDFVLDNLRGRILSWRRVPYIWLKQQSSYNPRTWVSLSGYKRYSQARSGNRFSNKAEARKYLNAVLRKIRQKKQKRNHASW